MSAILNTILNNFLIIGITLVAVGFIQNGFFWKFLNVKLSSGKNILVKIKEVQRHYYRVGTIIDGQLIYKLAKKDVKRISIPTDETVIYKSLGIDFIDVDGITNSIKTVNYEAVTGFDSVKMNDLFIRALSKPKLDETDKIIVLILLGIIVIAVGVVIFNILDQSQQIEFIKNQLANMQGNVVGGSKL